MEPVDQHTAEPDKKRDVERKIEAQCHPADTRSPVGKSQPVKSSHPEGESRKPDGRVRATPEGDEPCPTRSSHVCTPPRLGVTFHAP